MANLIPIAVTLDLDNQALVVEVEGGDVVRVPLALAVAAAERQGLGPVDFAVAEEEAFS
jgi:hypothetical protein